MVQITKHERHFFVVGSARPFFFFCFCGKWLLFNVLISSFHSLHSLDLYRRPKLMCSFVLLLFPLSLLWSVSKQLSHCVFELWLPFIKCVFSCVFVLHFEVEYIIKLSVLFYSQFFGCFIFLSFVRIAFYSVSSLWADNKNRWIFHSSRSPHQIIVMNEWMVSDYLRICDAWFLDNTHKLIKCVYVRYKINEFRVGDTYRYTTLFQIQTHSQRFTHEHIWIVTCRKC